MVKVFHSLKYRFAFFFILFIVFICSTITVLSLRQTIGVASSIFGREGTALVEKAAALIDGDAFEALAKSLDAEDPFYIAAYEKLHALKENSSCLYLYTMAPTGDPDIFRFIIDGTAMDDEENFSPLGAEDDVSFYDDAFLRCFNTGTTLYSNMVKEDIWGWLVSAYTPILNSSGKVVGLVGCDFEAESLYRTLRTQVVQQIVIALVFVLIGVVLTVVFLRIIFSRLQSINGILREISEGEGDLTRRIQLHRNDEIGELARYFNLTLEKIRRLVAVIKNKSVLLYDVGSELAGTMVETAGSINEITADIQDIEKRVMDQNAGVTETGSAMERITLNINRLNSHVEEQSASVAQSSAAIEEMLTNIRSVTHTLMKNTENVEGLISAAEGGTDGLAGVSTDIQEIARESEGLLEINAVMENIASQTNLLSMNAAIEAAHAGEAGKGFAVVADEIRKLAEHSGSQSKVISSVLKKIKSSIDKITVSTGTVQEKFGAINGEIRIVADQETHIRNAMEEQGQGSQQILEAVAKLNDITRMVKEGAREMLEGSQQAIQESRSLGLITERIAQEINKMASEAAHINGAVKRANEITMDNKEHINGLAAEVAKFKVE
jgi:methyl-accepting chemotaxis protein